MIRFRRRRKARRGWPTQSLDVDGEVFPPDEAQVSGDYLRVDSRYCAWRLLPHRFADLPIGLTTMILKLEEDIEASSDLAVVFRIERSPRRMELEFLLRPLLADWKKPWSIRQFQRVASRIVSNKAIPGLRFLDPDGDPPLLLRCAVSKVRSRGTIESELMRWVPTILMLWVEAERLLAVSAASESPLTRSAPIPRLSQKRRLAFISHDSRDKRTIVRPIAETLRSLGCLIWYDDYSLRVGQSLRESIERGIRQCHKCILILTPHFLSNKGWTRREFNSVFTRELIERRDIVLPVWAGVSAREVFEYSPALADRVAARWSDGVTILCEQLVQEIVKTRSSAHP